MNNRFSEIFIRRPVATTLLTIGVIFGGLLGYSQLPVSPLPQVDFPIVSVRANMPGASPDTMASAVASPLERHLGQIADVNEMTSTSTQGSTFITLQFGLDRNIDGAARDVQAAIVAARADLPTSLRQNPSYHKVNPADAPIMVIAMTSSTHTAGQLYDLASNVLQQRLSQLPGIGEVDVSGSALPAVRIEINPTAIFHYGIGLEDIRAALASANANSPKGAIEDDNAHYQIYANDQATKAAQYRDLVIAYRNGAAVKLSDVAEVVNSVEDLRNAGLVNGKPGIAVVLSRQPGANIITAVDNVRAELPRLIAALPGDVNLSIAVDRSKTIRQSLADTEKTLIIAVVLVIIVVFVFLRSVRAAAIPSVAVPTSIIGSFGVMYLLGFSLDNLSLMALDDFDRLCGRRRDRRAREYLALPRRGYAAGRGRDQGRERGRLHRAVDQPVADRGVRAAALLRRHRRSPVQRIRADAVGGGDDLAGGLADHDADDVRADPAAGEGSSAMGGSIGRPSMSSTRCSISIGARFVLLCGVPASWCCRFFATIGLNYYMFRYQMTYGLFPVQDTGLIIGSIQADQSISFQAMQKKLQQLQTIVQEDPAVASVVGFTGGRQTNAGFVYVSLKPFAERKVTADDVVTRLRGKLAEVAGARLFMVAVSDLRTGGRQSNATYQYTLLSDDTADLYTWAPKLTAALMGSDVLKDVNSDQQQGGLETDITIDRDTAMRLGLTLNAIDNTLYDAFGQRQVSTIYNAQNQYHVVMEVAPRYWQDPHTLDELYVSTSGANPTGVQQTGIAAGDFTSTTGAARTAATIAADSARNLATNALAASGHSSASAGAAVSTSVGDDGPALGFRSVRAGAYSAQRQSSGCFRRLDDLVQSRLRPRAERGEDGDRKCGPAHRHAVDRPRRFRRHGGDLPAVAVQHAAAVRRGAGDDLYRARHSLREPHPSDHDPFDPVLGQRRRGARPVAVRHPVHDHRRNRGVAADRHREEERDHDGRLRARGGAARPGHARGDRAGLHLALSADHDDDLCRPLRGVAARLWNRRGLGVAASSGDYHRRRPYRQSGPDAVYNSGRVYLSQLFWEVAGAPLESLLRAGQSRAARASALRLRSQRLIGACIAAAALSGCAPVGPNFERAAAIVSPQFKEIAGWKIATPREREPKGDWWNAFHDPELSRLESAVAISNQTVKADEASYREALALINEARAGLYPTINGTGSATRSSSEGTILTSELTGTWMLDVWGLVRREIEAEQAGAEGAAANLANALLTEQSALAVAYVTLRQADSLADLLTRTVEDYKHSLKITQNQYSAGTAAKSDVITAEAQVLNAQAQLIAAGVSRSQSEHAIAVLMGRPPAGLGDSARNPRDARSFNPDAPAFLVAGAKA